MKLVNPTSLAWPWTFPCSALSNCPTARRVSLLSHGDVQLATSVVDPGSGLEATLLTVTISSVTGSRLDWNFRPTTPTAFTSLETANTTAVRWWWHTACSGSFFVDINVTVLVSAFGSANREESFSLPLVIEPGEGGGATSFNLSATQGCSPLTVQGENLILDAGATYAWDFGNGQTSTGLNPTLSTTRLAPTPCHSSQKSQNWH